MMLWQIDEIRKALKLSKSKKDSQKLILTLSFQIELWKNDLSKPHELIHKALDLVLNDINKMQVVINAISESPTKSSWSEKQKLLQKEKK